MKAGLASEMKSEAICAGNMNITAADVKETAALDAKQYFSMALTRP